MGQKGDTMNEGTTILHNLAYWKGRKMDMHRLWTETGKDYYLKAWLRAYAQVDALEWVVLGNVNMQERL
jgi:hypothetical protein